MFPDGPFAFCRKESARFRSCPGQRRVPPALSGEVVFRICNTVRFRAIVFLPSWDSLTSETVRYLHAPGFPLCVVKTYGFGRVSLVYDTEYLTEELSPPHDT